jgi:hypothetical protein
LAQQLLQVTVSLPEDNPPLPAENMEPEKGKEQGLWSSLLKALRK